MHHLDAVVGLRSGNPVAARPTTYSPISNRARTRKCTTIGHARERECLGAAGSVRAQAIGVFVDAVGKVLGLERFARAALEAQLAVPLGIDLHQLVQELADTASFSAAVAAAAAARRIGDFVRALCLV